MQCRVNKSPPPNRILSHLSPLHTQQLSGFSGRATKLQALRQGCTNPGRQITMATTFCTVPPNICGSPLESLLRVTLLAARILRWFLEFGKKCVPLPYVAFRNTIVLAIKKLTKSHYELSLKRNKWVRTCCTKARKGTQTYLSKQLQFHPLT